MTENFVIDLTPDEDGKYTMIKAMGITEDRQKQLHTMIDTAIDECDTYPEALAHISKEIATVNELAWCAFHIGAFAQWTKHKHDAREGLESVLNKLADKLQQAGE